jgi:hypothetical protein
MGLWCGGEAGFDLGVEVEFAGVFGGGDGVFDGAGAGGAVDFEEEALDADEECAAVFFVVVAFHDAAEEGLELGDEFGRFGGDFFLEGVEEGFGPAFDDFEGDVAGEAVGDEDVAGVLGDVAAFDVADEVDEGVGFDEFAGFFDEGGAFFFFGADVEDGDARVLDAFDGLEVKGGHDGVLVEVGGFGLGVGAGIAEHDGAGLGGEEDGDAGAIGAGEGFEHEDAGGDEGAGVAGGDDRFGLAFLGELDHADDGGVAFAADGIDGGVVHGDDLGGVFDAEFVAGACKGIAEVLADDVLIADEDELIAILEEREGVEGTLQDLCGGLIATHGINGDAHYEPRGRGRESEPRP